MLEKPAIPDAAISACLREAYGLTAAAIEFLPLGADRNTAAYRVTSDTGNAYFVKLRSGVFDEMTLIVPAFLHAQGFREVIAPLPTLTGQVWALLDGFALAVFPFITGQDGYATDLLDQHWIDLGRVVRALHTAALPPALAGRIRQEDYSDRWRESVRGFMALAESTRFRDPVAAGLAALLRSQQTTINALVSRAADCAADLRSRPRPFVLCHADIHAANILIASSGRLYLVDWDTLLLAPRERDLMVPGGGQFLNRRSTREEESLFYQGYGPTVVDPIALAYYRCERIVEDIAVYCEQILLTEPGSTDRANGLQQLASQFMPGAVVEIALRPDPGPA